MKGTFIEFQDNDFEFAKYPISKDFIIKVFEENTLSFISYFGGDLFYVEMKDGEPMVPINYSGNYPEEIELVFDFMVTERIGVIKYDKGILTKGSITGDNINPDV